MKKTLSKILITVLLFVLALTTLFACDQEKWNKNSVTLLPNGKGEIVSSSLGGFGVETENYIYFINGVGNSTDDNTFGLPKTGALVAVSKNDTTKKCIVVPKLFVAKDYTSGLFIDGDYVYYGTPSLDKTSSGAVANNELHFARTKLDGTSTDFYFKASSLSTEYRIVKGQDGNVYIVYFDSNNSKLVSYNTNSKTSVDIAVKDVKTDKSESLNVHKFVDTQFANKAVVFFTTTVYSEDYNASRAEADTGYQRATEGYNKLYAYTVGESAPKLLLDGKENQDHNDVTFDITYLSGEYLFYSATYAKTGIVKNNGVKLDDLDNGFEVKNSSYLADTSVIVSEDEIYFNNNGYIVRSTLIDSVKNKEEKVAKAATIDGILFFDNGYIYYKNTNSGISRVYVGTSASPRDIENDKHVYEQVVIGESYNASWYGVEIMAGKLFYADASSRIKFVDLDESKLKTKYADEEETEIANFYFEDAKFVGVLSDKDYADIASNYISKINETLSSGRIVLEDDATKVAVEKAQAEFDALSDSAKALVSDTNKALLTNSAKAISLSEKLNALKPFVEADALKTDSAYKTAYDGAKVEMNALKDQGVTTYNKVYKLIENNALWYFLQAEEVFAD